MSRSSQGKCVKLAMPILSLVNVECSQSATCFVKTWKQAIISFEKLTDFTLLKFIILVFAMPRVISHNAKPLFNLCVEFVASNLNYWRNPLETELNSVHVLQHNNPFDKLRKSSNIKLKTSFWLQLKKYVCFQLRFYWRKLYVWFVKSCTQDIH